MSKERTATQFQQTFAVPADVERSLGLCAWESWQVSGPAAGTPADPAGPWLPAAASGAVKREHTACLLPCTQSTSPQYD